jgi:hypothetical protein
MPCRRPSTASLIGSTPEVEPPGDPTPRTRRAAHSDQRSSRPRQPSAASRPPRWCHGRTPAARLAATGRFRRMLLRHATNPVDREVSATLPKWLPRYWHIEPTTGPHQSASVHSGSFTSEVCNGSGSVAYQGKQAHRLDVDRVRMINAMSHTVSEVRAGSVCVDRGAWLADTKPSQHPEQRQPLRLDIRRAEILQPRRHRTCARARM